MFAYSFAVVCSCFVIKCYVTEKVKNERRMYTDIECIFYIHCSMVKQNIFQEKYHKNKLIKKFPCIKISFSNK